MGFGLVQVSGLSLVPSPPAIITAFISQFPLTIIQVICTFSFGNHAEKIL
jgi:hypothetical protein